MRCENQCKDWETHNILYKEGNKTHFRSAHVQLLTREGVESCDYGLLYEVRLHPIWFPTCLYGFIREYGVAAVSPRDCVNTTST